MVTRNNADISELVEFGWHQWLYYRDATEYLPLPKEELGKYIWPYDNVGSKMSTWILKYNDEIVSITTLRTLTDSEIGSEREKTNRGIFTKAVNKNIVPTLYEIGIRLYLEDFSDDTDTPSFTPYLDNEGIEEPTMPEADAVADYDKYIESEVLLPSNGKETSSTKAVSWVKYQNGKVMWTYNNNPILDTRVYNVMFPDG